MNVSFIMADSRPSSLEYWVHDYWNAWAGQSMMLNVLKNKEDKTKLTNYPIQSLSEYISQQSHSDQCPKLPASFQKMMGELTAQYNALLEQRPLPISDLQEIVKQAKKEIYSISS